MQKIKSIIIITLMLLTVIPLMSNHISGGPIQSINITFTPGGTVSILVTQSSWSPSSKLNESNATATDWTNLDNNGNVQVDVTVNASDTTNWILGASPSHNQFQLQYGTNSGETGVDWTEATASADWEPRCDFGALVYDGKMWVIGGWNGTSVLNDTWYSTDGVNWVQATANADWEARWFPGCVVYDNKMWVMGGQNKDSLYLNDTWYSTDGVNWTQATANANWTTRQGFGLTVYDNKMWVMGGNQDFPDFTMMNDVWYSTDGINWIEATASANWTARNFHSAIVFNGKLWIVGGFNMWGEGINDTWYTTDGISWTQGGFAEWSARGSYTPIVVYDNKMWFMGGIETGTSNFMNDVWYSSDGITWTEATASADWCTRSEFSSIVFDNKLWIMGGYDSDYTYLNETWYTSGSTSWTDISTSPATFISNLAYDASQDFGLQIFMPTTSSTNAVQTLVITFTATAD